MDEPGTSDRPRDDIRLLGQLLGETIAEQAGAETFAQIEAIRRTAMRFRRQQEREARSELEAMLAGLDDEACLLSVQPATLFAQLSNIAEDLHLKRLAHGERMAGRPAREGSLEGALNHLRAAGIPSAAVVAMLRTSHVAPVLTAHPTEVQRRPFFRSTTDKMDMVLAKTDVSIAARYATLVDDVELRNRVFPRIDDEFGKTRQALLSTTGQRDFLEHNPRLRRSIHERLPYLDPLNHLQIELLHRHREGRSDERLRRALHLTVNGIASCLCNSG
jgi:phosphoenolpyruvate carboxylase